MNVGVVGVGSRGRYLARAFSQRPETNLVAVCDVSEQAIQHAREELGPDVHYYPDLEEMCQREPLQIGVVASWDPAHRDHAVTFLNHDLHVYHEKPMAQSIEDCDDILRAWEGSTGTLLVGLELRYCTLCQEVRKLLDADEIGDVKLGMAVDNVSVGGRYYYHNNRRLKSFINSLMLEKGTHTLDLMNWFIGSTPTRVFAEGGLDVYGGNEANDKRCRDCERKETCPDFLDVSKFIYDYGEKAKHAMDFCAYAQEVDVDDNCLVTVRYENGAKMSYMECHFTPDYNRHFTLVGDKGRLYAFYNNEQEFVIRVHKRFEKDPVEYHPPKAPGGHGGGDPRILDEFIARAGRNEHSCPGAVDARNSAVIAIAAAKSCETNLPVNVPPFRLPQE
jgi:predicted dehydrogenase